MHSLPLYIRERGILIIMEASDFDFQQCIGQGSYAKVMLSKVTNPDSKLFGEEVAVKILDKKEMMRYNKQRYVLIEKNVFVACNHPNIVKLKSTFQDDLSLYFVMELSKDGTLFDKIHKHKKLPEPLVRHWVGEVVLALEHMHSKKIVHRDLKPENILIHEDRHVRLTDFGTCRILTEENEETASTPIEDTPMKRKKSFVGTAEYVAPELLENRVEQFYPLDWWSLGILIFQSLTGTTPFKGGSEYLTFQAIIEGKLVMPSALSSEAKDIISKLLHVDWKSRLGTNGASEVKEHPFFKEVDWLSLSKMPVPPEPEIIEAKESATDATPLVKHGSKPSFYKQCCCCCCGGGPQYSPDDNTCSEFLMNNERILCESVVSLPSCFGLSSKERILILTDFPRIFFLDYANQYVDIEATWSTGIYASPQSDSFFVLHLGNDAKHEVTLKSGTSGEWASRLNEVHNRQT